MKAAKFILACFAIILALVAIATWIHPVVSMTIIVGGAIGTIFFSCYCMDEKEKDNSFHFHNSQ